MGLAGLNVRTWQAGVAAVLEVFIGVVRHSASVIRRVFYDAFACS